MARQRKTMQDRSGPRDDESLLLRSAQSLGRVIGVLQRQLDSATRRLGKLDDESADGHDGVAHVPPGAAAPPKTTRAKTTRKPTARKTTAGKTVARKTAAAPRARRTAGPTAAARTRATARKVKSSR